jgi:CRP-like cAMP-binding protein
MSLQTFTTYRALNFRAGEILMAEGETGTHAMVIESGEVEISVRREGSVRHLANAGPGEIVGEMALIDNEPRSATVTAITDCVCRVVPGDLFRAELAQSTLLIHSVTEILTRHLRRMDHL